MPHPIIWLKKVFGRTRVATKCGHKTKLVGQVSAFGETTTTRLGPNKEGEVEYCHACLGSMAILCAWCNQPIFIGEPVTLLTPIETFQVPEYAIVHDTDPLQLVGCLHWDCVMSGMFRAGFWMPGDNGKGCVHRVQSPLEAMLAAKTPSMVVVDDLTDMSKAGRPKLIPIGENGKNPK